MTGFVPAFSQRPWGEFETVHNEGSLAVKLLTVKPNQRLSLQRHAHRNEKWVVLEGSGSIDDGSIETPISKGHRIRIPATELHRLAAGPVGITILELQFAVIREDDIERLEDDYGRREVLA